MGFETPQQSWVFRLYFHHMKDSHIYIAEICGSQLKQWSQTTRRLLIPLIKAEVKETYMNFNNPLNLRLKLLVQYVVSKHRYLYMYYTQQSFFELQFECRYSLPVPYLP
jgi:hypothetical protein